MSRFRERLRKHILSSLLCKTIWVTCPHLWSYFAAQTTPHQWTLKALSPSHLIQYHYMSMHCNKTTRSSLNLIFPDLPYDVASPAIKHNQASRPTDSLFSQIHPIGPSMIALHTVILSDSPQLEKITCPTHHALINSWAPNKWNRFPKTDCNRNKMQTLWYFPSEMKPQL